VELDALVALEVMELLEAELVSTVELETPVLIENEVLSLPDDEDCSVGE